MSFVSTINTGCNLQENLRTYIGILTKANVKCIPTYQALPFEIEQEKKKNIPFPKIKIFMSVYMNKYQNKLTEIV